MSELHPRFRIRAPLRCDGIGRLDCAEDAESGERLAVRWLPLEANGAVAVRAVEQLPAHAALPKVRQTGQVGAAAFAVVDFPQGETLAARGRLSEVELLRLASQLSQALAALHAQGVVHGEISPDSVLLTADGRAVLWDIPLVVANRLTDRRGESRLLQQLSKSAPYLSPERARGEGASSEGDVYALGAMLCVAAGAPLPSYATTLGLVHLVATGAWAPRVPEGLPERLRESLGRMVSPEPARRPAAPEVATVLAQLGTAATVPELRLPQEILDAADALLREQAEATRAPSASARAPYHA